MSSWDYIAERRWAIQAHSVSAPKVYWFSGEAERAKWIGQNPLLRMAVGKRHPAVKAFRQAHEAMPRKEGEE